MTNAFKLSTAAALALFALAGAARAEDVRIDLSGKDARTIHAEIIDAAYKVCSESDAEMMNTASQSECVSATIAKAEDEARRASTVHMASAQQTTAPRGER
jgi:sRNA-binding protein